MTVPPGARVPPAHSHTENEEVVYVRDVAEVAGAANGPDPVRMMEVMTRYGLVLARPKPAAVGSA